MSAFGSNPDLASTAASSLPMESPTSRNIAGLVSPTRTGFPYNAGHAMSGFKPATLTSARSNSIGGPSPMTLAMYAASSSNAAGPGDISPTQPAPTNTGPQSTFPHQSQPLSAGASSSMVIPTRRLAHQNSLAQPDSAGSSRPRAGSLGAATALSAASASPFASSANVSSGNSTAPAPRARAAQQLALQRSATNARRHPAALQPNPIQVISGGDGFGIHVSSRQHWHVRQQSVQVVPRHARRSVLQGAAGSAQEVQDQRRLAQVRALHLLRQDGAMSQLRRETSAALPEAKGERAESGLHASTYP